MWGKVDAPRAVRLDWKNDMSGSLIINARHRLAWHQRLLSDASTAMMWGGWLWLWAPLLRSFRWLATIGARSFPAVWNVLASAPADELQVSFVALVGTSGTLLALNWLPSRKICASEAQVSVRDYARHLRLPERELEAGRHASVCVVHHDDSGRIVRLECREPAGQLQAMAG